MKTKSEHTAVMQKDIEREKIQEETERFLENGGAINQIEIGRSGIFDKDQSKNKTRNRIQFKKSPAP